MMNINVLRSNQSVYMHEQPLAAISFGKFSGGQPVA
jgi:hypothetical protein